ncbi:ABC transporter substrate-binding protein [Cohnella sp. CFH 77786]|uniref:ABC transporter substrate-binding protein n=1 Tax=Cohnella sp. CFH 77786 TaxID=2662265 RepID=UPI001C6098CA|nr:ABC transporter substrate-binding protein [Cohnella sp. CFH 77786]
MGGTKDQVKAVARRKLALIFLLLFMFALLLSPWASAPSPPIASSPKPSANQAEPLRPAVEVKEPVSLRVAVPLDEAEFEELRKQNERQSYLFRDIRVVLERTDPADAYSAFRQAARLGEAADVMLLKNEWVKAFASSGYLVPADAAFVGEALSEQFDALSAPLKWNGYLWGVPRDFDPYVLVWNLAELRKVAGESAVPPPDLAGWADLAAKARASGGTVHLLALDAQDPLALLAWVEAVTGQRTDTLWQSDNDPWNGTAKGEAIALLEREKAGVAFGVEGSIADALAAGETMSAILPNSAAHRLASERSASGVAVFLADRYAWKLPFVWPRGRSFAISSRTQADEAARRWIAAMTDAAVQQANWTVSGKLPVYRSLYANRSAGGGLSSLFPVGAAAASSFPGQPPAESGPELPGRLDRLGRLWSEFAAGKIGAADWIRRWPETLTDLQLDD